MNEILVSVIIPAYNCEKTLKDCLESVEGQRLKEKEIIVVNDGSTDYTADLLRLHPGNIRVITQKNSGAGAARNNGLMHANGKFVAFMDTDDKYPSSNVLEKLVAGALDHNVSACGGSFVLWENGKLTSEFDDALSGYTFKSDGIMKYSDYQFDYGYHRFIYEKRVLDENNIRFPDYLRYQDPPFMVKALDACGEFYAMRMPAYLYHAEPAKVAWNDRKAVGLIKGLTDELNFSREKGYAKLHKLVVDRITGEYNGIIADAIARGEPSTRRPMVDMCAAISGALLGQGEDYLPRPMSDLMVRQAELASQLYACETELKAIKGSADYRLAKAMMFLPRKLKHALRIGARDRSF